MFYQVDGNAATNSQFYATDSTKHFVTVLILCKAQFWLYYAREPVILKWHAAFNGDFKMEVILKYNRFGVKIYWFFIINKD
jgi:hypothetical protein